jgi:hypothetical protein
MSAKFAKISVLLIALALTPACTMMGSGGTKPPIYTGLMCDSVDPIRWSRSDTIETVRQVKEFNAAYKEACLGTK